MPKLQRVYNNTSAEGNETSACTQERREWQSYSIRQLHMRTSDLIDVVGAEACVSEMSTICEVKETTWTCGRIVRVWECRFRHRLLSATHSHTHTRERRRKVTSVSCSSSTSPLLEIPTNDGNHSDESRKTIAVENSFLLLVKENGLENVFWTR
jgi:hypothetical protein